MFETASKEEQDTPQKRSGSWKSTLDNQIFYNNLIQKKNLDGPLLAGYYLTKYVCMSNISNLDQTLFFKMFIFHHFHMKNDNYLR